MPTDNPGPLSGDMKIPGVGTVPKGLAIVGGGVVIVLAIVWWRNRKAAQTPAAVDSTPVAQTFQPAPDLSGGGGGGGSSVGTVTDQVSNGPPFNSNAAWAQYVTTYLVDTLNKDPGAVSTDLGAYLAGEPVTQDQADLIRQATAYGDLPPVAGPNGMPPSINVIGSTGGLGNKPGAVQLAGGAITDTTAAITWPAVTGAAGYGWTATGPNGFSRTGTLTTPGLALTGLTAATSYTVTVHGTNAAGAGPDGSITVRTAAAPAPTPAPAPAPAPGPTKPAGATGRYTIQHGDTLSGIAARFHVTVSQLLAWNLADLDAYARKFGHPNSNNGNLIFGGLPIWV